MLQSKCDLPGTPQHGGSIELADTSQATQPHGHLRKTKILFTVSIRNQVYWNNVEWKKRSVQSILISSRAGPPKR